jgi:8-oxo-dGTP pyrophosphatase MutT (NUDIX family)
MMTADHFRLLAKARLRADAPTGWDHSDDDNNERARLIPAGVKPKASAVLIGMMPRDDGLHVLLTERDAGLSKHAGQIAFPGGRMDAGETALQAALREAEEETGLPPDQVETVGYLDGYLTVTGFFIVPVVALLKADFERRPRAGEVADIFDVPLAFFLDDRNREIHEREWNGLTRNYNAYPYGDRYIWGATAGILKNLARKLEHAET